MYNNVYQEYINNMMGTLPKENSDFGYDTYRDSSYFQNPNITNIDLEKFYPDLYKLLYPMIQTSCMRNTKPITEETIDEMVKEIYSNFNADDINLTNDVRSVSKTSEVSKVSSAKTISKISSAETRKTEEREEGNFRQNNFVLNDLIRILLIRELLGRPGNRPTFRPGFPGPGPGRPPFRPRDFGFEGQNYDIYEHLSF